MNEDWEEFGMTPGEACRELDLEVDGLLALVLEGHYLPSAAPNDLCWPALFDRARIRELKADLGLLAAFRATGSEDLG